MKSTSSWLIFCVASSLLVLTTLVPFLWSPYDRGISVQDQSPTRQTVDQQDRIPDLPLPQTQSAAVKPLIRPEPTPLVVIPAVAVMPRQDVLDLPPTPPIPRLLATASLPRIPAGVGMADRGKRPLSPPVYPPQPILFITIDGRVSCTDKPPTQPEQLLARSHKAGTSEPRGWQADRWPYSSTLADGLQAAESWEPCATWAKAVHSELLQLSQLPSLGDPASTAILERLASYARIAPSIGASLADPLERVKFFELAASLQRRIQIWRCLDAGISRQEGEAVIDRLPMQQLLMAVFQRLGGAESRQGWHDYLLLEQLASQVQADRVSHDQLSRLARTILQRIGAPGLSSDQQAMLQEKVFRDFEDGLRRLGCQPISHSLLLEAIERLEHSRSRGAGRLVAKACQRLEWSPSSHLVKLSEVLESQYRQGNIRLTISEALVNRLLPDSTGHDQSIDNHLKRTRLQGDISTTTSLRVVLVPDHSRWHIGIEVDGVMKSKTHSSHGPATFYNEGESRFLVRKQLLLGTRTLETTPAVAQVTIDSRLVNFTTDFDDLPLLGDLARNMARRQYRKGSNTAQQQLQERLARGSEQELDQGVSKHLSAADAIYQQRWRAPLERLQLFPQAVSMQTHKDKLIIDYRIAGNQQLAGFGKCPAPPEDSLLQLQLHESAVNNLLEQLKLDGRRGNLPTLVNEISSSLGMSTSPLLAQMPDDVIVEMSPAWSVNVRFENGSLRLQLNLRELRQGNRLSWRNFSIVAFYRPNDAPGQVSLVREGQLSVIGRSIGLADRIALQGIFNKVFSRTRAISLMTQELVDHPALVDTQISQHVVDNGWLCIAVGEGTNH